MGGGGWAERGMKTVEALVSLRAWDTRQCLLKGHRSHGMEAFALELTVDFS